MTNITKKDDLVIPIYLDTNTLLDLLASIEGGFSIVDKITTRSADSKTTEVSAGGEFGIGGFLNFFKINLHGDAKKEKNQESEQESRTERYHTYGSLLNRLRLTLLNNDLLQQITSESTFQNIQTSDFIESRGKFIPNPFTNSIKILRDLLGLGIDLNEARREFLQTEQKQKIPNQKNVLDTLLKDLEHKNFQTFIVELTEHTTSKIVVSLFSEYLRDRAGKELPYGEFRLLGKVIRKIKDDDTFDLLKGSALAYIGKKNIQEISENLKSLGTRGIEIPEIVTQIKPPAIQVIPIAVYI